MSMRNRFNFIWAWLGNGPKEKGKGPVKVIQPPKPKGVIVPPAFTDRNTNVTYKRLFGVEPGEPVSSGRFQLQLVGRGLITLKAFVLDEDGGMRKIAENLSGDGSGGLTVEWPADSECRLILTDRFVNRQVISFRTTDGFKARYRTVYADGRTAQMKVIDL